MVHTNLLKNFVVSLVTNVTQNPTVAPSTVLWIGENSTPWKVMNCTILPWNSRSKRLVVWIVERLFVKLILDVL